MRSRSSSKAGSSQRTPTRSSGPAFIETCPMEKQFRGFKIVRNSPPKKFSLRLSDEQDLLGEFQEIVLPNLDEIITTESHDTCFVHSSCVTLLEAISCSPDSRAVFDILYQRLQIFADTTCSELFKLTSIDSLNAFWHRVTLKLHIFGVLSDAVFSQVQPLASVFEDLIAVHVEQNPDAFTSLCEIFCDAYNNDVNSLSDIAHFFRNKHFYKSQFVPRLVDSVKEHLGASIADHYDDPLADYLRFIEATVERESEKCARLFDCTDELSTSIFDLVFTSRLEYICDDERGLKGLITDKDIESVSLCSKLARATNASEAFTSRLASIFAEEAENSFKQPHPIEHLLALHRDLCLFCDNAFGPQTARTIKKEFEAGFNKDPDVVARLLAVEINRVFSEGMKDLSVIEEYGALCRLLSMKDVFEAYYTRLLTRRVIGMNSDMLEAERFFATKLREQCGENYTARIDQLLDDREESEKLSKTLADNLPSYFRISLARRDYWPTLTKIEMNPPEEIGEVLEQAEHLVSEQQRTRKLEWVLELSQVTMKVLNVPGVEEITCTGDYASILIALGNNDEMNIDELCSALECSKQEIELRLSALTSKKCRKIVTKSGSSYRINKKATAPDGVLNLGSGFRKMTVSDETNVKATVAANHDYELDAAIILALKPVKSMEKRELMERVAELVRFRMDEDMFTARINKLLTQDYIRTEPPSTVIHFVP